MKPKVFVSCGELTEEERKIASKIAEGLTELGFEPYVAVNEQTLEGLKSNLFRQLETSEYFLFVDFKRDLLANSEFFRGSLFTNQELAIASYLGLECIAFQEEGLIQTDGMLSAMQLNVEPFSDRSKLVATVLHKVRAQWQIDWKNSIVFRNSPLSYRDAIAPVGPLRFHFLDVANLHNRRPAEDCQVFPTYLGRSGSKTNLLKASTELKWSGYMFPWARIRPKSSRMFDALVVDIRNPSRAFLHSITDAADYQTHLDGAGTYEIEFEVTSSNFATIHQKATITLGTSIDDSRVHLERE